MAMTYKKPSKPPRHRRRDMVRIVGKVEGRPKRGKWYGERVRKIGKK